MSLHKSMLELINILKKKIFGESKHWEKVKSIILVLFFISCLLHELKKIPKDILRQEKHQFLSDLFNSLL